MGACSLRVGLYLKIPISNTISENETPYVFSIQNFEGGRKRRKKFSNESSRPSGLLEFSHEFFSSFIIILNGIVSYHKLISFWKLH